MKITVEKSQYKKCVRCRNHRKEVGENEYFPDLCQRCWNVVADMELI
jgi:isoleucyl-tRNA synthetase